MNHKAIAIFINGEMFLIKDENFTNEQKSNLEILAKNAISEHLELTNHSDKDILIWFINHAKENLNLNLEFVEISFVLRINQ